MTGQLTAFSIQVGQSMNRGERLGQIDSAGFGSIRSLVDRLGRKPIWATEFGYSTGTGGPGAITAPGGSCSGAIGAPKTGPAVGAGMPLAPAAAASGGW